MAHDRHGLHVPVAQAERRQAQASARQVARHDQSPGAHGGRGHAA